MFVYRITNAVNGKIYIGQHKGNNLRKYLQDKFSQAWYELKRKGHGGGSYLFNSMRKHGREAFTIEPLAEVHGEKAVLDSLETFCISVFDSRNPEVGYNIQRGGEGFTGPHSEETKQKLRMAVLGRKHTPDAIARMKAIPRTEKQLANLNRNGMRFIAEETREKIRKTGLRNSQFGTCWVQLNGSEKKIEKTELSYYLQQGWTWGRTVNVRSATGDKINGIELLRKVRSKKNGMARWLCRCHCGSTFTTWGAYLRNGHTKSCGCSRKRRQRTESLVDDPQAYRKLN